MTLTHDHETQSHAADGDHQNHEKLGEVLATSPPACDIGSCPPYVGPLSIQAGGWLSIPAFLMISGLLYLARKVYSEVVGAIPRNGGSFTALLNGTNKYWACLALCLTTISYVATVDNSAMSSAAGLVEAFTSHKEVNGAHTEVGFKPWLESSAWTAPFRSVLDGLSVGHQAQPKLLLSFLIIGGVAGLVLLGVKDSARVSLVILGNTLLAYTLLVGLFAWHCYRGGQVHFGAHWATTSALLAGGWTVTLMGFYKTFSMSLLGISGFESSANMVEEQRDGVFPKTLRNMWLMVTVINPIMNLVLLGGAVSGLLQER